MPTDLSCVAFAHPISTNAAGRRSAKDVNGAVTRYVYDDADILLEFDGANVPVARYTHGPGVDEPLVLARDADGDGAFGAGERFVYHRDGLGSVVQLTDAARSVARAYGYDAFGRIADETGSLINPYAFTGRERDGKSGLYFYRARYYDPETGRFLSEDPIGFGGNDENLYRYVFNSPTNFNDPNGLEGIPFEDSIDGNSPPVTTSELVFATAATLAPLAIPLLPEAGAVATQCLKGLFGRGGILNNNRFLRIGVGRKPGGHKSFRAAGKVVRTIKKNGKIDFFDLGPL